MQQDAAWVRILSVTDGSTTPAGGGPREANRRPAALACGCLVVIAGLVSRRRALPSSANPSGAGPWKSRPPLSEFRLTNPADCSITIP